MKKLFFKLPLYFLFFITSAYSQDQLIEKASDYNNFIVDEQNQLILRIIDYNISNIYNNNAEENNQKRLEIIRQIDASIEKLNSLPPFKGDAKLRDEAFVVFTLYKEACDVEFNEINTLRKERENSFESMRNYLHAQNKAEVKLKEAGEKFIKAQQEFARKHKITIKDGNSQNYFKDVAPVNQYSREVTLEYFRVSKIDAGFLEALNQQQSMVMEEKRKEILSTAEISLKNLSAIFPYRNDTAYKAKAIVLVNYHIELADKEYLELVRILQKKSRTQDDVNRYNQLAIRINDTSQKLVTELNKENKEMLKRHIPVY